MEKLASLHASGKPDVEVYDLKKYFEEGGSLRQGEIHLPNQPAPAQASTATT